MRPAPPRGVGLSVRRVGFRARLRGGGRLHGLQPQLLTGPLGVGGRRVFLDDVVEGFRRRSRIVLGPVRLRQPVEGLLGHRMIPVLPQNLDVPGLGRVGTIGIPVEGVGQPVACHGALGLHLGPARGVARHRRHVDDLGRRGGGRPRLSPRRRLLALSGRRGALSLNGLHAPPVVDEGPLAPGLLELSASLLHEGGVPVEEEARVGAARLHGVLLRRTGGPAPARSRPPAAPKLPLLVLTGLGLFLALLQSSLPNLLHHGLKLGPGHLSQAQERVHARHRFGVLGEAAEPIRLLNRIRRRSGQHLFLVADGATARPVRQVRGRGIEVRCGPGEVFVPVPVQHREVVVDPPPNFPSGRLVTPQQGRQGFSRAFGTILDQVELRADPCDLAAHRPRVVAPLKRRQLCQGLFRSGVEPLHLEGRQSGGEGQRVRRVVLQNATVRIFGPGKLLPRLAHLPEQEGPSGPRVVGQRSLQSLNQGLLRRCPVLLPDRQDPARQPHAGGPGAVVRFRVQSGPQRVRGLRGTAGRQKGLREPKPGFALPVRPQGSHLPKFLGRPDVVLLVISGPPDQEQRVVDPLRVRVLPQHVRTFLNRLLKGRLAGTPLGRGKDRKIPGPIDVSAGLVDRFEPRLERLIGVIERVIVGREVVVLAPDERPPAAPQHKPDSGEEQHGAPKKAAAVSQSVSG